MMVYVTAYPYAVQYGRIDVPDDVEDIREYVSDNWDDIDFGDPELDYVGCDFEVFDDYELDR